MSKPKKDKAKKRVVQVGQAGQAHIQAKYNNIIISMTNEKGEVISSSSAGKMGFRGSKKSTPYAAQRAAEDCAREAYQLGLRRVDVFFKGAGVGKEAAARAIGEAGIEVAVFNDVTPMPHNGCRPPKRRRP